MNIKYTKKLILLLSFLLFAFVLPDGASGQNFEQRKRIEEEKRTKLQATENKILAEEDRLLIEWGGWIDMRYDQYNEDDNDASLKDAFAATSSLDTRIWVQVILQSAADDPDPHQHSLYLRAKNIATITSPEDVNVTYDNAGPHLDQGYVVLDYRPWEFEFGRRYFSVGQGIAYGNVHDGFEANATFSDWNLKSFFAHTLPHEDNIDVRAPGALKKSDRSFYGLEMRYIGFMGHGIYGYGVVQRDSSNEDPINFTQDFTYDSEYLGLGLQGKLLPQMFYWAEVMHQSGESHIFGSNDKRHVKAWAGDFGTTYNWDVYSHPSFTVEYAFGTGDADRVNVTDTQFGNTLGQDNNFLHFGYLPTGFALAPRLSNIHMYRAGVLLKPLENIDRFRNLSFGLDYYHFLKYENAGGISDLDATVTDKDIGDEINVSVAWQFLSDATLTLQYGYFIAGDAFADPADDSETYFSTDLTLIF
ncbi:MAG: alginate export family protein [Candidatus Omnitrophica bacterium]|nr:alginate export family protein [Candidatus Omnitrophota bacterium]